MCQASPRWHSTPCMKPRMHICRALQELASDSDLASDASTTIRAIKQLTRATQAPAPLAMMLPSAQAALAAPAPSLRILGCHIIAQWLRCTGEESDTKQPVSLLLYMLEVLAQPNLPSTAERLLRCPLTHRAICCGAGSPHMAYTQSCNSSQHHLSGLMLGLCVWQVPAS